jgi:hypothetical protein
MIYEKTLSKKSRDAVPLNLSRLLMFPILFLAHAVQFGTGQKRTEIDGHRKQGCQGKTKLFILFKHGFLQKKYDGLI